MDECRDWLAIKGGWSKATRPVVTHEGDDIRWYYPSEGDVWFKGVDMNRAVDEASYHHPINYTLDRASAAMPDGWRACCTLQTWIAHSFRYEASVAVSRTPDEKHDRFRLAIKARMKQEEHLENTSS